MRPVPGPLARSLTLALAACGGEPALEAPPDGAAAPAPPAAAAADVEMGERASFPGLSYQVPARWSVETPSSGMRRAQYRVPRAEGDAEDGECALFVFPGTGGSVEANLQRWYGQFTQPDGRPTESLASVESFEAGGLQVTMVDVSGTYSGGMGGTGPHPAYRMVSGIVETGDPWFLKCTGPEATMGKAEPEVRALLQSMQP